MRCDDSRIGGGLTVPKMESGAGATHDFPAAGPMTPNILLEFSNYRERLNMKSKLDAARSSSVAGQFTTDACGEEHTTTIFGEECSALPPHQKKGEGGPFGAY
jgi:hypothetical protein